MCGIAGLIHRGKSTNVGGEMQKMLQSLKHRGPDSTGYALVFYTFLQNTFAYSSQPMSPQNLVRYQLHAMLNLPLIRFFLIKHNLSIPP